MWLPRFFARRPAVQAIVLATLAAGAPLKAAQLTATWTPPGNGNWSTASAWSTASVPSNGANTFLVVIDGETGSPSIVTLDVNATIDGLTISGGDTLTQADSRNLIIATNAVTVNGTWNLASTDTVTYINFQPATTINGTGKLVFTDNTANQIQTGNTILTVGSGITIEGAGSILANSGGMANAGLIRSDGTSPLSIDPNGLGFTNTGILRGAGSGGLVLIDGAFTNTGGTINAADNSHVNLGPSASFTGGTLSASGTGELRPTGTGGSAPLLSGLTITGKIIQSADNDARADGTITNNSSWILDHSGAGSTDITFEGGATLTGTGSISLNGDGPQYIYTNNTTMTQEASHTIRGGGGNLLANSGGMINKGSVIQDGEHLLLIDPNGLGFKNESLLEAEGTGGLQLSEGAFNNAGGTIRALEGSFVAIGPSASISGGTLTATGTGELRPTGAGGSAPLLSNVLISGPVSQTADNDARLNGTTTNNSTWTISNTGAGDCYVQFEDTATLTGTGSINFAGTGGQRLTTNNTVLTQSSTHTLRGGNTNLLANTGGMINQGTVKQEGSGTLTIDPNGFGFKNENLIEATGSGGVQLVEGGFNNTGGTIRAADGSIVDIGPSVSVSNGTITTSGSGVLRPRGAGGSASLLTNVTNTGLIGQGGDDDARIQGTLTNNARWSVNHSGAGDSAITFENSATLAGTGTIDFLGASGQTVYTNNTVMTQEANHTIRGGGVNLLANSGGMINKGTVKQEGTGLLTIDPNGHGFKNENLIEATGSGGIQLIEGAFNNTGGTIRAVDGSIVDIGPSVSVSSGTITTTGSGVLRPKGAGGVAGLLVNVTNTGLIGQGGDDDARVQGTLTNNATWSVNHSGEGDSVITFEDSATIAGSGTINFLGGAGQLIRTNNTVMTQEANHTIRGGGVNLLANSGGVLNKGKVIQEGSNAMLIDPNGFNFTNEGLLEATGSGGLQLYEGTFINTGGQIKAAEDSFVAIGPFSTITGGSVFSFLPGDVRPTGDGGSAPLLVDVSLSGIVSQLQDQDVRVKGQLTNAAEWTLYHTGSTGTSSIQFEDGATLTGEGRLIFAGDGNQQIVTNNTVVTIDSDQIIRGGGANILANSGGMINKGTIEQTGVNAMVIDPNGLHFKNTGMVTASGSGGLQMFFGEFDNTDGVVGAFASSFVAIGPSANLRGGVFTSSENAALRPTGDGGNAPTLRDMTVSGRVDQLQDQDVFLRGTVRNEAAWTVSQTGSTGTSFVELDDNATIDGPGSISFLGDANQFVYTNNTIFTHGAEHTLRGGAVNILANSGGMRNLGHIIGEGDQPMAIDPNGLGVRNLGLIEAQSAAGLVFLNGFFSNGAGGRFVAKDASVIEISSSSTIDHAVVESEGTGFFRLVGDGGSQPTLDTAILDGEIHQSDANDVRLLGYGQHTSDWTVTNDGVGSCDINLEDGAFLSGAGELHFAGPGSQRVLTNNTIGSHTRGHVLRGRGSLLANTGGLRNHGSFIADDAGTLAIDANGLGFVNFAMLRANTAATLAIDDGGTFLNRGRVEVASGGTLAVANGNFTQASGSLDLEDGTVNIPQNATLLDIQGGSMTGTGSVNGDVRNRGDLKPGNPIGAIDLSGVYTQLPGGVLEVTLGGPTPETQHDVLAVTGATTLAGRLNIALADSYTPTAGDSFTVLTHGTRTGEFDAITGRVLGGGMVLLEEYNTNDVTLTAVQLDGIASKDAIATEGDTNPVQATFRVTLFPAPSQPVTVTATVTAETATEGSDYTNPGPTQITFAIGQTEADFSVAILPDTTPELEELFTLTLTNSSGPAIALATATGVIRDNDTADCNSNSIGDAYEIASGDVPDLNHNGIPDSCDIGDKRSFDCNQNGVPDEAEPDCNGNGIPDECDIAEGYSTDEDLNGQPDDCTHWGELGWLTN